MAIQKTNIKLFASERLDDTDEGAGSITGTVIQSGAESSIFSAVSRMDRAYGRISIRQIFPGVDSNDTDVYAGAHVILSQLPADPYTAITLFTAQDWDAKRSDLRDYLERYLGKAGKWQGYLQEKQLTGQKVISVWQRAAVPLPEIGAVWCLVQNEGLSTQYEQYVRITRCAHKLMDFYEQRGEQTVKFTVRILTVELSDALLYDFEGVPPTSYDVSTAKATIRETLPIDAAHYFGMQPLVEDAASGDMTVSVASLYSQLVPSSQSEMAVTDVTAASQNEAVIAASQGLVSFTTSLTFAANVGLYLGNGCLPGTLAIASSSGALTDVGGEIRLNSTTVVGLIAYGQGVITFNATCPNITGSKTVAFQPAAAVLQVANTAALVITPQNRGYVYTETLSPIPAPGALFVDYLTQGKWYRLYDYGTGELKGLDSSYGAGSINFATGTVAITLGALPDNGSKIIFYWGTQTATFNRSNLTPPTPAITWTLAHAPVAPNTLTIAWPSGNSLSDNGSGLLTGTGGAGQINYSTGRVTLTPTTLPLGGTQFSSSYTYGDPLSETFPHPSRDQNGEVHLSLAHTDIIPKSVELEFNVLIADYEAATSVEATYVIQRPANWVDPIVTSRDNGNGSFTVNQTVDATINYATGEVVLTPELTIQIPKPLYSNHAIGSQTTSWSNQGGTVTQTLTTYRYLFDGWEYIPAGATMPIDETGYVTVRYRAADTPQSVIDETYVLANLQFDLTPHYNEAIISNSLRFTYGGLVYFDRDGSLYHSLNPANGSAMLAGAINLESGVATLTSWTPGTANSLTLQSLLTRISGQAVDQATFRTAAKPVRVGSLQLRANQLDGTLITATAALDGTLTSAALDGSIDYENGIVQVRFGQWLTATGHESEPWYDENAIRPDGKIFKPLPVNPDSIRYNCVVYTYLPLNADILGLNPARLPFDGKVIIYKPGDLAVLHNTARVACPNPLNAGTTVSAGRVRLSRLEVRDTEDVVVDPTLYTEDLDAGTVNFADPLNLTGYTLPLYLYHTLEDMALVVDTDISGRVSLSRQLTHDFDKTTSFLSSALPMKIDGEDLFARWSRPFSQQTWTNVWSDTRIGSEIIPAYNYNVYPFAVANQGCVTQKWAIIFTSPTAFRLIGNTYGGGETGSVNQDFSPLNPNTNTPYFTILAIGWGANWSTGNVLRFNTYGANFPLDIVRTVLQSAPTAVTDSFRLEIRGDIL